MALNGATPMLATPHPRPALEGLVERLGEATTLGEVLAILGRATSHYRLERVDRNPTGCDVIFRVGTRGERVVVACAKNGAIDGVVAHADALAFERRSARASRGTRGRRSSRFVQRWQTPFVASHVRCDH